MASTVSATQGANAVISTDSTGAASRRPLPAPELTVGPHNDDPPRVGHDMRTDTQIIRPPMVGLAAQRLPAMTGRPDVPYGMVDADERNDRGDAPRRLRLTPSAPARTRVRSPPRPPPARPTPPHLSSRPCRARPPCTPRRSAESRVAESGPGR